MAEKGFILSAEEELKLREPIDEYIGKIQEQIDALRLDGTDKVRSLKNHIAVVKESKNLSKEEKTKIIENDKKVLEEANAVESRNKDKVNKFFRLSRRFIIFQRIITASTTIRWLNVVKLKKRLKRKSMREFVQY